MRFKSAAALAALALFALAPAARAQDNRSQKDEKVIDDFVTTRGFIFNTQKTDAKPKAAAAQTQGRRRPAAKGANSSAALASKKNSTPRANGAKQTTPEAVPADTAAQDAQGDGASAPDGAQFIKASAPGPIALGYTLYLKDDTGALIATDASRVYKKDDAIALSLETNTDGFLYVFNATDGRDPVMLFPSAMLDGGANAVRAHVRETYPAAVSDAFVFDEKTGVEHLYVVFSREPLAGVPTGEALEKLCAGKDPADCTWRPGAALWSRLTAGASDRRVVEARSAQIAQLRVPAMPDALQRGITLKRQDPKPAVVRVSDSPAAKMLVTKIELTHR